MKKIAIMAALTVAATASFGAIAINWSTYGFLSGADENKYASQDGVKLLWDLVYTTESAITDPTYNKGEIQYSSTDEVLSRREWNAGSTAMVVTDLVVPKEDTKSGQLTWDPDWGCIDVGSPTYKNFDYTKTGGGVYSAVFQFMADGTVYYDLTPLEMGVNWSIGEKDGAQRVWFGDGQHDYQISKTLYQVTPVPEPATMSLLGLGALAMVIRRKLRK